MSAPPQPPNCPWFSYVGGALYLLRFPADVDDAGTQDFIDASEAWLRELDQPVAWLIDCRDLKASSAPAHRRKMLADYEKRVAQFSKKYFVGGAFIIDNSLVRGVLTAIYWINPPVYPYKIFATEEQAREWACQQLKKHGAPLP